ncbi:MAG TPA: glycerol-3-phosphate 1-O-acyltransferase PlsY [Gemmatimonadales bacterium]
MRLVLLTLGAYLVGAIPASYLAAWLKGIDLRQHGSKNLGATNVYRVLGWRYALPVALFDVAKGVVPVLFFARWGGVRWEWFPAVLGAAAVVGHVFSPFVGFKGGKGVATAAGVFLALAPLAVLITVPVWAMSLWLTGYVSLSSLIAAAALPILVAATGAGRPALVAGIVLALMIVYTHRGNIRRLLAGTESRFRTRKQAAG